MSRKYRKLGLRRDNNLADVENKYTALSNLLNGLASPGESFLPDDIFVINDLRNTNVVNEDFTQIKGLKLTYLDQSNTERTLTPIVRLEDRLENYKSITGSPPYLSGGDGLNALFIPSENINPSIDKNTTGSTIIVSSDTPNYGPLLFWDNGSFEFESQIYPDFVNTYGMIQWEGYFAPTPGDQTLTISYFTSGLLLIEQDPLDNGSWETVKSIYNKERIIQVNSPQAQSNVSIITVGDEMKYLNIGDKLKNQETFITNVNLSNNTIELDQPINLSAGNNTLTFVFDIGREEVQGFTRLRNTYKNDKIKIRITVWWPDPNDINVFYGTKTVSFLHPNSLLNLGSRDLLTYNYLYSTYQRQTTPGELSIEYFLNNYLSPTNTKTDSKISVNSNFIINYIPPLLPADRFSSSTMRSFTYTSLGKIERSNSFADVLAGDYFIRKSTYPKTYIIKEKQNNSTVYINFANDIVQSDGQAFDGFVVKQSGLVGVYNINSLTLTPLTDNDFNIALVKEDQLIATIDNATNAVSGFFRISTYDFTTGALTLQSLSGSVGTASTAGIAVVYRSSALEDLSKLNFCLGVIGKEAKVIATQGSTKIYLKNTLGLSNGMYAQLTGFIPTNTQITLGSDAGGSFVTLSNPTTAQIDQDVTLTFSLTNENKELCVVPLNTAPPFAGTQTGLITQSGNESLVVNKLTSDMLTLTFTDELDSVPSNPADRKVSKSLEFLSNGQAYRFLIR